MRGGGSLLSIHSSVINMADRLSVGQLSTLSFASLFFFFLLCRVKPQARKQRKERKVGRERRGEEKKEAEGELRKREGGRFRRSVMLYSIQAGLHACPFFLFSSSPVCTACM